MSLLSAGEEKWASDPLKNKTWMKNINCNDFPNCCFLIGQIVPALLLGSAELLARRAAVPRRTKGTATIDHCHPHFHNKGRAANKVLPLPTQDTPAPDSRHLLIPISEGGVRLLKNAGTGEAEVWKAYSPRRVYDKVTAWCWAVSSLRCVSDAQRNTMITVTQH